MNWKEVAVKGLPAMLSQQAERSKTAAARGDDAQIADDGQKHQVPQDDIFFLATFLTKQSLNEIRNAVAVLTNAKANNSELLAVLIQQIQNILDYTADFAARLFKVRQLFENC